MTTIPATPYLTRPDYLLLADESLVSRRVLAEQPLTPARGILLVPDNADGRAFIAQQRRMARTDRLHMIGSTIGLVLALTGFIFTGIILTQKVHDGLDATRAFPNDLCNPAAITAGLAMLVVGVLLIAAPFIQEHLSPRPQVACRGLGQTLCPLPLGRLPRIEGRDALEFLADAAWMGVFPAAFDHVRDAYYRERSLQEERERRTREDNARRRRALDEKALRRLTKLPRH